MNVNSTGSSGAYIRHKTTWAVFTSLLIFETCLSFTLSFISSTHLWDYILAFLTLLWNRRSSVTLSGFIGCVPGTQVGICYRMTLVGPGWTPKRCRLGACPRTFLVNSLFRLCHQCHWLRTFLPLNFPGFWCHPLSRGHGQSWTPLASSAETHPPRSTTIIDPSLFLYI